MIDGPDLRGGTRVPESGIPESGIPNFGVPESGVPESGVPESGVPETGGGNRLHRALDRFRAHPTGRVALKIGIGILGASVVAIGIVLIPLPGPGWALVILGLAILAVEFVWARRLLHFTRQHVRSWTHWVTRQSLPLRVVIGAVGLVLVAAICWFTVTVGFGVDLTALGRRLLGSG